MVLKKLTASLGTLKHNYIDEPASLRREEHEAYKQEYEKRIHKEATKHGKARAKKAVKQYYSGSNTWTGRHKRLTKTLSRVSKKIDSYERGRKHINIWASDKKRKSIWD